MGLCCAPPDAKRPLQALLHGVTMGAMDATSAEQQSGASAVGSHQPLVGSKEAAALDQPMQFLKGVGPARAKALEELGIVTCRDLLDYLPRDYERFEGQQSIGHLAPGELAAVEGEIIQTRIIRRRPMRFEALLDDGSGRCILVWFNRWGLEQQIQPGVRIRASGKIGLFQGRLQITQPKFDLMEAAQDAPRQAARINAVYGGTARLGGQVIARIVAEWLDPLCREVDEWFAESWLQERKLMTRRQAYQQSHQPRSYPEAYQARRTLAYHEFFLYQLVIALKRYHLKHLLTAKPLRVDDEVDRRIRRLLHFGLTKAQEKVIAQIKADISQPRPMNRLLQGDVGCGKTVVALFAMLMAVASGGQAVLLAPTELLAEQHYFTLGRYLAGSRVQIGLLAGSVAATERARVLAGIQDGSMGLVVGTHAVLGDHVAFKNLWLLVVDEQHKFGVRQRGSIRERHAGVHTLVMTATPIPRTLAMTYFGDLDVSVIDELPPGRSPIITRSINQSLRPKAYEFLVKELNRGRQAYIVAPAIEENIQELASVESLATELRANWLAQHAIGVIHGRMDKAQRQALMDAFRAGEVRVLIATSVIEVGIDVPNATVMIVEHAERFGLSQLHQLRGRVGRGDQRSYCVLIADEDAASGEKNPRLAAMVKTSSGFVIAEEDLKIRGMGEIVGTRQSGRPDFHLPELLFDEALLSLSRQDALALVQRDPHLIAPESRVLRQAMRRQYADMLWLADVG